MTARWPADWQQEAIDAVEPLLGTQTRIEVWVGPPHSLDGTCISGLVYLDGETPMMVWDDSGQRDVYPWKLLDGPVLRIYELRPRRRKLILFADPNWIPRDGEKGVV